jgi:hypothetical protein
MGSSIISAAQALYQVPELSQDFVDIDASLVFNYVLQPGTVQNGLQQPISADGDYYLCGMQMSSVLQQRPDLIQNAGNAAILISDDTGYRLFSDYVNVNFMSASFGNSYPFVISPTHVFKSGTKITIDLQELSNVANVPNIIQVIFRGRYRYRVSDLQIQSAQIAQARKMRGM